MEIQDIVNEISPSLKDMGYHKKKYTWENTSNEIHSYFWIEKSQYSREIWYYWWGIFLPNMEPEGSYKTSPFKCQIRFRSEKDGLSGEALVALTARWEEMYGTRQKIMQAAVSGRLPMITSRNTISHILMGDF